MVDLFCFLTDFPSLDSAVHKVAYGSRKPKKVPFIFMVGGMPSPIRVGDGDSTVSRCYCETDARVHLHGGRDPYAYKATEAMFIDDPFQWSKSSKNKHDDETPYVVTSCKTASSDECLSIDLYI